MCGESRWPNTPRTSSNLLVPSLGFHCRSRASVSYGVLVINRRTASTGAATAPPPRASKAQRKTPFPTQAKLYATTASSSDETEAPRRRPRTALV